MSARRGPAEVGEPWIQGDCIIVAPAAHHPRESFIRAAFPAETMHEAAALDHQIRCMIAAAWGMARPRTSSTVAAEKFPLAKINQITAGRIPRPAAARTVTSNLSINGDSPNSQKSSRMAKALNMGVAGQERHPRQPPAEPLVFPGGSQVSNATLNQSQAIESFDTEDSLDSRG
ncbi:hypothetical protein Q5752_006009 [Cryptotrichosporon argae]